MLGAILFVLRTGIQWNALPREVGASTTVYDRFRLWIEAVLTRGTTKTRVITRARILLKSADGWSISQITHTFDVSAATVSNVRQRFARGGITAVLTDRVQQRRRSAFSGVETAHLIAIASTPAPDDHDHWTVRLLADKAVELGYVEHVSLWTIHHLLKKTS